MPMNISVISRILGHLRMFFLGRGGGVYIQTGVWDRLTVYKVLINAFEEQVSLLLTIV